MGNYASQGITEKIKFTKKGMLMENECFYEEFINNYIYGMSKKL